MFDFKNRILDAKNSINSDGISPANPNSNSDKNIDINANKNMGKKAVMYVRMSTDHQKYSTENQETKIVEYAAKKNFEIIKRYEDAGKSGLKFEGRIALQQMLADVQLPQKQFDIILVLDVTRWGRFQDADESAYYEYICKRAGIEVHYVAEMFENDGSVGSNIVKSLKRTMAGEYSRELSNKVFAGQCRLIEKGFKQGGSAGFGLRRMMIDEHGNFKTMLEVGQRKSLQTDRVVLMPGPEEEIETVNWIYKCFIEQGFNESAIAALLNDKNIKTDLGRHWSRGTIHQVLTNEKYIGNNVFNRTSYKLKMRHVKNPPEMWVRHDNAFDGIIEPALFYTAQGIIRERSRKVSNEEMLDKLKNLHEKFGCISGIIIDEADGMPSSGAYTYRFGSLLRAYELIGYSPERDFSYIEINKHLRQFFSEQMEDAIEKIEAIGGVINRNSENDIITINNELKVSIVICRCIILNNGTYRWKVHLDTGLLPDVTIIIRMDAENKHPLDYYLLPSLDVENPKMRLSQNNGFALDSYKFDDLEPFFMMTERDEIPIF
jgi:DNA invertase Pin-like site-specific DNA recombinase